MLRIAVCGIDGSGKSTLIKKLLARLVLNGIPASSARVPFDSKIVFNEIKSDSEELTREQEIVKRAGMAFDFIRYYKVLGIPEGVLICDRYRVDFEVLHDVYHLPNEFKDILSSIYEQAPKVDLYIYLKADFHLASTRLEERGDRKNNESDEILRSMQQAFDSRFSKFSNVIYIDAAKPEDEIENEVFTRIIELWGT